MITRWLTGSSRWRNWIAALAVSTASVVALVAPEATVAHHNAARVEIQGHRGARGLLPESTLAGFEHALRLGVDILELDVGLSKDGVVVISHDAKLNPELTRDADGQWLAGERPALRSLTYAEIARYNVGQARPGSMVAKRFPDQAALKHAPIPRLRDLFALTARAQASRVRFNIELKIRPGWPDVYAPPDVFADAVASVIESAAVEDRVTIQSFDWRALVAMKVRLPAVRLAALSTQQPWFDNIRVGHAGASPWTAGLDVDDFNASVPHMVKTLGVDEWSPNWRDLNAENLKVARDLGLEVSVWTVNLRHQMGQVIELGVDSIITDYPDRLRAELVARKRPVPAPIEF